MPDGLPSTTERNAAIAPGEALARALADPSAAWPDVVLRDHQIEALDELAGRLAARRHPHLGGRARPARARRSCSSPWPRRSAAAPCVLVPRRNLADQTAAALARHFPSIPTHPEGPESAGRPGVEHLHLPGGAAPSGADGLGLGHPPDLRRGPRHPGRADAAPAGPGDERGRRGLHRHGRDHHRARGAGLRPGRGHPRPPLGDRARHPLPAALAARRAGGRPLRRGQGARRLRPGQPGARPRPGPVAPRLRRGVGGALPAPVDWRASPTPPPSPRPTRSPTR